MSNRWSSFTDKIRQRLPHWWKLRKDKKANGADFLNVMGLTLEDVEQALNYAMDQYYIEDADIQQVDIIYKTTLPYFIDPDTRVEYEGNGYRLEQAPSLDAFLNSLPTDTLAYPELYYQNPYYIDWDKRILYTRKPYVMTPETPEGSIIVRIYDDSYQIKEEQTLPLHLHHVWNVFDEFGLLMDVPRLYGEKNEAYIQRILNVFRHPANASRVGLLNGIARELAMIYEMSWPDGGEDLIIERPRVVPESIEVDGQPMDLKAIAQDESGRTILAGSPEYQGKTRRVSFEAGLDIHQLYDKQDYAFQDLLYTPEGTATPLLEYYVQILTDHVPMIWGKFVFGQAFWDVADEQMSGIGFLPSLLDAEFEAWKNYVSSRR